MTSGTLKSYLALILMVAFLLLLQASILVKLGFASTPVVPEILHSIIVLNKDIFLVFSATIGLGLYFTVKPKNSAPLYRLLAFTGGAAIVMYSIITILSNKFLSLGFVVGGIFVLLGTNMSLKALGKRLW